MRHLAHIDTPPVAKVDLCRALANLDVVANDKCPNTSTCALFPLISKPGFLRVWQINYCEGDYSRCERLKRQCDGGDVPTTLLPNGQNLTALVSGARGDGKGTK